MQLLQEVACAFDPSVTQKRRQNQIQELLCRQESLKDELLSAKKTLMVEPESWSYDRTYITSAM